MKMKFPKFPKHSSLQKNKYIHFHLLYFPRLPRKTQAAVEFRTNIKLIIFHTETSFKGIVLYDI